MFKYLLAVCLVASVALAHPHPEEHVSHGVPNVVSQEVPVVLHSVPAPDVQVAPAGIEHVHQPQVGPSYYAPGNFAHLYGNEHIVGNKPVQAVRNLEQFGQPEPAALPAHYKPWGSWGLYIGGNPADGYYSNYYKALGNSVDKQVSGGEVKPFGDQTAAFSPVVRQASSLPYLGADYYPFAYSPGELNSASRAPVDAVPVAHPVAHGPVSPVSPVQAGAQIYGPPAGFDTSVGVSSYADSYASKKVGSGAAQSKGTSKSLPSAPAPATTSAQTKSYQTRSFLYPVVGQLSAPLPHQPLAAPVAPVANQQQVVAYPVPIGSQIVGSQVGVDGAFSPYGVHAFTRYAVKPALVEPSTYYYNSPSPFYGNQYYSSYYTPYYSPYYSSSYYSGYGSHIPHYSVESAPQEPQYSPVTTTVEVVSEKAESDDKLYTKGQTKI